MTQSIRANHRLVTIQGLIVTLFDELTLGGRNLPALEYREQFVATNYNAALKLAYTFINTGILG